MIGRSVARSDLGEVRDDAAPARAVVIRIDGQQPVGPERRGGLRELDRVAGVVGADPGDHRLPRVIRAHLVDHELDEAEVLVVIERRRLTGGSAHHDTVTAVAEEVLKQRRGGRLIHLAGGIEGRHHRGQDRAEVQCHAAIISGRARQQRPRE